MLDCLIIGGGPAGLTAATYLARYRRIARVIDSGASRARQIPLSHNYPGFKGIAGPDLLRRLRDQAETFGADIRSGEGSASKNRQDQAPITATIDLASPDCCCPGTWRPGSRISAFLACTGLDANVAGSPEDKSPGG